MNLYLYLRLLWVWILARRKPRIRIGDTIDMRLRVWPTGMDVNGHMNIGRCMTSTDLATIEYFTGAAEVPSAYAAQGTMRGKPSRDCFVARNRRT